MGSVYFNHDYDTLTALADKAWKAASNDSSWTMAGSAPAVTTPPASATGRFRRTLARRRQVPEALADYVHGKGLEFGLWFEPEMVNPDSDMFRNHPDWC